MLWRTEQKETNMPEFFQTNMGHKFYGGDVPRITKALESIAKSLEVLAVLANAAAVVPHTVPEQRDGHCADAAAGVEEPSP